MFFSFRQFKPFILDENLIFLPIQFILHDFDMKFLSGEHGESQKLYEMKSSRCIDKANEISS